jgi:hypothetical protein
VTLLRLDVEGFRSIDAISWRPGDATVLTGPRADDLCAAAMHVSNTASGWSTFSEAFADEPPHPPERFTDGFAETRCFAHLGPADEGEALRFGYELLVERAAENNAWAIVYERFTLDDDFDLRELLERRGSRAVFTPAPKRGARAGAPPPKEQVVRLADDMTALGAMPALASDPRVEPHAARLGAWRRYGRIDPSPAGAPRRFVAERVFHDRLSADGRNLANALFSLWDFDDLRAPVLAGLRALDPTVEAVTFPTLDDDKLGVALAHADGRATPLAAMSDAAVAWLLRCSARWCPRRCCSSTRRRPTWPTRCSARSRRWCAPAPPARRWCSRGRRRRSTPRSARPSRATSGRGWCAPRCERGALWGQGLTTAE